MNKKRCPVYLEPKQPVEKRVAHLLGMMSLEEKIGQMRMCWMQQIVDGKNNFSHRKAKKIITTQGLSAVRILDSDLGTNVKLANAVQKFIRANTRLKIPAIMVSECLHGYVSKGVTVFPQSIALGSTWNPELIGKMGSVIAGEARSTGSHQALSPMLDIAREPRWGRTEESYGEDPYLVTRMGVAFIKGIQGEGPYIDSEHLVATVKHFAAHGRPEGGLNIAPVPVTERELRTIYMPPYEAGVKEAKAKCVMPAYHEIDGVPCHCSEELLTGILREEWGFDGYIISDFEALSMLYNLHHTAGTAEEAGKQAVEAGVDMEAPCVDTFNKEFVRMVREGKISEAVIDRAAGRILKVKFLLGLFENTYVEAKQAYRICHAKEHRRLALEAARQSIVLLKNEDNFLPLNRRVRSIAVIGPSADVVRLGGRNYAGWNDSMVTVLAGIKNKVSSKTKVHYAPGCHIYKLSTKGFREAVDAAGKSEVAVVVVGEDSELCSEWYDRADLNLPGVQLDLLKAVHKTGVPVVVVLLNGRPLSINWVAENVSAVIEGWYLGEEGGTALADVLFGDYNPGGKLPITFPRSVGQLPVWYNRKPSAGGIYRQPGRPGKPGRDYVFSTPEPLFEFGYGLSYTKFKYSNLRLNPQRIYPQGKVYIRVDVKNIGKLKGDEVVQLYINDEVSSTTTPVKELKGFERVTLKAGEKKTVNFTLTPEHLSILDRHMESVVESGTFKVMIDNLTGKFEVIRNKS